MVVGRPSRGQNNCRKIVLMCQPFILTGCHRQLDFVFVSESIADRVFVKALNSFEEWEPSDHCRIMVSLDI